MKIKTLLMTAGALCLMTFPARAQNQEMPAGQPPPQQGRNGGGPDGDHAMPPPHGGMFMEMDTNRDGFISKEEFLAFFDKVDINHDGKLSHEELRAYHEAHRHGGPSPGGGPQGEGQDNGPGNGPRNPEGGAYNTPGQNPP